MRPGQRVRDAFGRQVSCGATASCGWRRTGSALQGYDGSRLTRGRHTYGDPLVVTNDAWLGRGSRVLSGVTIGDGAVVGAYTVVTKDVRPYAIVVRHPAREIRRRLTDEQVDALERIGWWDWPDERIVAEVDQLSSHRLDAFIAAHDPGR